MIKGLIGKKIGMTQTFNKDGLIVPVTVVETGPCTVLEIKESPKKIKLGFDPIKESKLNKPQLGFFKKLGVAPMRTVREVSSTDNSGYTVGQEIKADFFKAGDFVDIQGISIGKGFQGGMKRHGWKGGGATHGSMHHRRVGSIGSSAYPSRPFTGRTMPGHMGDETVTVQSLRVIEVNVEKNLVFIKGAIPGQDRGTVIIKRSQKRAFKPLDEKIVAVAKKVNPLKQSKKAAGGGKAAAKGGK